KERIAKENMLNLENKENMSDLESEENMFNLESKDEEDIGPAYLLVKNQIFKSLKTTNNESSLLVIRNNAESLIRIDQKDYNNYEGKFSVTSQNAENAKSLIRIAGYNSCICNSDRLNNCENIDTESLIRT
ncbi:7114_t:CDS:2, partial [Scutellospora calospora]